MPIKLRDCFHYNVTSGADLGILRRGGGGSGPEFFGGGGGGGLGSRSTGIFIY